MPFATAPDGARIYYETAGAGEPLLLISGQGGDHHGWDEVRTDFTDRYRTISFDHRGTGASDKPDVPYSTRGFAADAVAVLDAAGVDRAHAYGTSMGGRIAQWLGIEHSDRFGTLVLGCTTPGDAHGVARSADAGRRLRAVTTPENVLSHRLIGFTQEWIDAHPEVLVITEPLPEPARILHYRASQGHDTWDLLPRISTPTLVIHGGDDELNPTANAPLLAGRIPGAELHIVPRGRHSFFVEFRAESTAVVRDFLSRHPLS
jgi:pimeloyl-ACP methyl ester carboxylesterase